MNPEKFIAALDALSDDDLQQLSGELTLCMVEDASLKVDAPNEVNGIELDLPDDATNSSAIRAHLKAEAATIVDVYYRHHALTMRGFNNQVKAQVAQDSWQNLSARSGQRAELSLFVDSGEVVVESRGNPRHPYGAYLELESELQPEIAAEQVKRWLESGEAYRHYLSMNACRYNC